MSAGTLHRGTACEPSVPWQRDEDAPGLPEMKGFPPLSFRMSYIGMVDGPEAAVPPDPMSSTDHLIAEVYDELKSLAEQAMRRERIGHTLQPSAIVNELYLRLDPGGRAKWESRAHFFGAAASAIRRILIEHARRRGAHKRTAGGQRISLDAADDIKDPAGIDLLELDDALKALERVDPRLLQVVQLRYFGGLTMEEIAQVTGRSKRTIESDWALARAWLKRHLTGDGAPR